MKKLEDYIKRLFTDSTVKKELTHDNRVWTSCRGHEVYSNHSQIQFPDGVFMEIGLIHNQLEHTLEMRVEITYTPFNIKFDKYFTRYVLI